jgi:hypothetical protein
MHIFGAVQLALKFIRVLADVVQQSGNLRKVAGAKFLSVGLCQSRNVHSVFGQGLPF